MSGSTGGRALRSYRRRKAVLDLDLNRDPPGENRELEDPSNPLEPRSVQAVQPPQVVQPIDVEAIEDDVIESTASAFAEARNNSRRNRGRTIVDVDLDYRGWMTIDTSNNGRRDSSNQTIFDSDLCINLEGSGSSEWGNVKKAPEPPIEPVFSCPPEPPMEPVFSCPICMGPFVEEVSTRCGHIFCKSCIKAAITAQGKCPTCRKKVTAKELIRVFLPSTS